MSGARSGWPGRRSRTKGADGRVEASARSKVATHRWRDIGAVASSMRALMILRIVTGRIERGRIEAVRESFRETYIPIAARAVGLERYTLGSRPRPDGGDELAAVTLWRTLDDART